MAWGRWASQEYIALCATIKNALVKNPLAGWFRAQPTRFSGMLPLLSSAAALIVSKW